MQQDLTNALSITAGDGFSCARTTTAAYCWGWNGEGELGNGTLNATATPTQLVGIGAGLDPVAGPDHACGRDGIGMVYCWGSNEFGQLGMDPGGRSPAVVPGLS